MARTCDICEKKYNKAMSYSWLRATNRNPTGIRRQHPNLQKVTMGGKALKACTKCIKSMHKVKTVKAKVA